jgi:hypothetical protein
MAAFEVSTEVYVDRAYLAQRLLDRVDPYVRRADMSGKQLRER